MRRRLEARMQNAESKLAVVLATGRRVEVGRGFDAESADAVGASWNELKALLNNNMYNCGLIPHKCRGSNV